MERVCFLARVRPDRLEEYREAHRRVWPEMTAALSSAGWTNYTIFLADDGLLVGYLETDDYQAALKRMAPLRIVRSAAPDRSYGLGIPVRRYRSSELLTGRHLSWGHRRAPFRGRYVLAERSGPSQIRYLADRPGLGVGELGARRGQ